MEKYLADELSHLFFGFFTLETQTQIQPLLAFAEFPPIGKSHIFRLSTGFPPSSNASVLLPLCPSLCL